MNRGHKVRIVASHENPKYRWDSEVESLIGKEGVVTGRMMAGMVEVRITLPSKPPYGYLFYPSELETSA